MDVQEVGTYFYLRKYTQNQVKSEGFGETRKFRFLEPGSSGFQQLYHYLARDLPFHPSFTISHTARHFPVRRGDFVAIQGFDQGFQGAKVGSW